MINYFDVNFLNEIDKKFFKKTLKKILPNNIFKKHAFEDWKKIFIYLLTNLFIP
jgi:uncharacterized protein (DUF2344 family)